MCATNAVLFIAVTPRLFVDKPVRARDRAALLDNLKSRVRISVVKRGSTMTGVWTLAALWLGLALIASLLSIWLGDATALSEIVVGTIAQLIIGAVIGSAVLGTGRLPDRVSFRHRRDRLDLPGGRRARSSGFQAQMAGSDCDRVGRLLFSLSRVRGPPPTTCSGWEPMPSFGSPGVAMSTTSVAVVYAVMLEYRVQCDGIRQDSARGLLHQRPWNRRRSWSDIRAVYDEDFDLPWA